MTDPVPTTQPTQVTLRGFQEGIVNEIVDNPYYAVFLTMGGGKTLITLTALSIIQPPGPILVVAPKAIAIGTWPEEVVTHNFPVDCVVIDQHPATMGKNGRMRKPKARTKAERAELYDRIATDPPKLYTVSNHFLEEMVEHYTTGTTKNPDISAWPFWTVIVDESQTMKNAKTARFKALAAVRPAIGRLLLLSGTPASEEIGNIWAQVYLLDQGAALYDSEAMFRAQWFKPIRYGPNNQPVKWAALPGAEKEIYDRIRHLSVSQYDIDLNLPPQHFVDHQITPPADLLAAYRNFKKKFILSYQTSPDQEPSDIIADNAAALYAKLMQFAAGALYLDDDEGNTAQAVEDDEKNQDSEDADASPMQLQDQNSITSRQTLIVHNLKIAKLLEILEHHTATDGSPVIIAYRFNSDRERIMYHLTEYGYAPQVFDKSAEMKAEWNRGEIPIMLIHPASAGHGLNFQFGGHTLIWFSLPNSGEQYQQTNARLHRIGQTHEVTVHRILLDQTMDANLPAVLAQKARGEQALFRALHQEYA